MTANNWDIRIPQIPLFLGDAFFDEENSFLARYLVAHRRGGKSFGISKKFRAVCTELLHEQTIFKIRGDVDSKNPKLAFFAPTKVQARQIIWDYFQTDLLTLPGAKANKQTLTITIPRPFTGDYIEVLLLASKQHDRVRGLALRYAAIDEVQDAPEDFMRSVGPALKDSRGEAIFSGTAKGEDHFFDMIKRAISMKAPTFMFPVTRTNIFSDDEIRTMIAEYERGLFLREMMCAFTAPLDGAIYYNNIKQYENNPVFLSSTYNPYKTTYMACDIGIGEGFAAWVYQLGEDRKSINIRDFYTGYDTLQDLHDDLDEDDCMPDVIQLPHDGGRKIVSASKATTQKDVFREVFKHQRIDPLKKPSDKMVNINTVRQNIGMLRFPRKEGIDIMVGEGIYEGSVVQTNAHNGLKKVKQHCRKVDKQTGRITEMIDKSRGNDHAADALETAFMALKVKKGVATRVLQHKVDNNPSFYVASGGYRRANSSKYTNSIRPEFDKGSEVNYPVGMFGPKGGFDGHSF